MIIDTIKLITQFYETCMALHIIFLVGFKLLTIFQLILYIFAWEKDIYKQNRCKIYFRSHLPIETQRSFYQYKSIIHISFILIP
jgi:hypothetical protein